MKDFVIGIGRTNIDLIYSGMDRLPALGEEIYSTGFEIHLGGGAPGESVILSKLGIPSKIITWLGKGPFADIARSEFTIGSPEIIDLYHGTGNPMILSTAMLCCGDRTFVSYGEEIGISSADMACIREEHRGAKIVLMNPQFSELYDEPYLSDAVKIFDTGWEDDLSLENEKYRKMITLADYYLPNRREAMKITGTSTVEDAAEVLSRFFRHVIIKLDKDGCMIRDEKGQRIIPPLQGPDFVDATGAGDAFLSGFAYGLYHGYNVDDCVRFGNITGGTCVQAYGCVTKTLNENELIKKIYTI